MRCGTDETHCRGRQPPDVRNEEEWVEYGKRGREAEVNRTVGRR